MEDSALEPSTPEKVQIKEPFPAKQISLPDHQLALQKKLIWTEFRVKELESAVTVAVSEKVSCKFAPGGSAFVKRPFAVAFGIVWPSDSGAPHSDRVMLVKETRMTHGQFQDLQLTDVSCDTCISA